MKKNWEIKKLGDVCSVSAGQGAPQGDSNYCTNGTPFIKAGNLEDLVNGFPEINIQNVSEDVAKKHRLKLYKAGSVVFAKSGMSCMKGYVYTLKNDCYVVSHLAILTPNAINSFFLKYLLEFYRPNSLVKDSAYPSISLEDIKTFPIPVPPLEEQERIVGELDCLSGVIEKKKEQLKELDALAQSIFYEMFGNPVENDRGWEVKKLGKVSRIINGFAFPSSDFSENNQIKAIKITNVGVNEFVDDSSSLPNQYECKEDYKVHTGDIVIALTRTIISAGLKRALVPKEYNNALVNQRVAAIIIDTKFVDKSFVYLFLGTEFVKDYVLTHATALMQPNLSIKDLRELPIICPPLLLQQKFAEKIELIEKQKELVRKSIEEVEMLFNSRMEYYFN